MVFVILVFCFLWFVYALLDIFHTVIGMSISAKLMQKFRNLKADEAPRAPPAQPSVDNNDLPNDSFNKHSTNNGFEDEDKEPKGIPKFFDANKKNKFEEKKRDNSPPPTSPVYTQATGSVINIVNSSHIHCGLEIVYNTSTSPVINEQDDIYAEDIKKTPAISRLLAADIKPEHVYMDCISKNLGKGWKSFFRSLGYLQGRIETVEETESKYGVAEVRYKLLLEWKQNDDNGTLGALASALWAHGEKHLVRELAAIYVRRSS